MARLNDDIVRALPVPTAGNKVHYFADAKVQGKEAPRGFGVRVTAAGVRSFVMNYRVGRKERRLTIGQHPDWSVLKAIKHARQLRQTIDSGQDPLDIKRKREAAAEAAAVNSLQAICEEYFRRDGKDLRTRKWREDALKRLVYPQLGKMPIGAVRRTDVVRLLDKIEDENGPVMADRTLSYVGRVMNWHASRSDDFRSPIVRGMARTSTTERARSRILSDDELRAVWKACEASQGVAGAFLRFVLLTACRRNEAAQMPRGEIEEGIWTLPEARNKTKQDLMRPLSPLALKMLPAGNGKFLFSNDGTTALAGFDHLKKAIHEASGTAGWCIHDLRRTARSLMSRAGVNPDIAERCLGHKIGGVRAVYDRWAYLPEKRQAFEALALLIERIVNPPVKNVTSIRRRA